MFTLGYNECKGITMRGWRDEDAEDERGAIDDTSLTDSQRYEGLPDVRFEEESETLAEMDLIERRGSIVVLMSW